MIPIHLTIEGIYSYQEKQSVDFTRLTGASIFGIFGPVGSGKSTILEAITFALYGRTDRLNLSGDNRNYNMMNLKSNELLIEFIFKTGKEDVEYLVTVKGRRNSKQFEDVKTLDRAAYKKSKNEWIPIETEALETIIGLSYENFKRTIIIPQGRFQEFLQLGKTERTQMMKELFHLEKYELFPKVISLESKNNREIQITDGQLIQLGVVNPEQIKISEEALVLVKNEIAQKTQELSIHQQQEIKLNRLKEDTEKLKELNLAVSILKQQEPEIILLENRIKAYEYCHLNFKSLIDSAKENSERILNWELSIRNDNNFLTNTANQLSELDKELEVIKKDYDHRELLNQQADELDKVLNLRELNGLGQQLNERISNGEKVLQETLTQIIQSKLTHEALLSALKEIKEKYPDMVLLAKIKDWFTNNNYLESLKNDIHLELKSLGDDIFQIEQEKDQLWKEDSFVDILPSQNFKDTASILEDKKLQIKALMVDLDMEIEHLSVQSKLEAYATQLEEGQPCPLCGSFSHPQTYNAHNVSEALLHHKKQKEMLEKKIMSLEQGQKRLYQIKTKFQQKKELQEKTVLKQNETFAKIKNHGESFSWNGYENEQDVQNAFDLADQLQVQIKEKEKELEKLTKKLEEENQNKEKFSQAIEGLKHQITDNSAKSSLLADQIKLFQIRELNDIPKDVIIKMKESLLQRYQKVENLHQTALLKMNSLKTTYDTISGKLEANRKTLEQELVAQKTIAASIEKQLKQSAYDNLADVQKVLSQTMDIEKEKEKVANYRQTIDFSLKQSETLLTQIGNQKFDTEQYQQVLLAIEKITEVLSLKHQYQGKLESDLKQKREDLETWQKLTKHMDELHNRAEDIKTLKQLFKANGFVNYISSVYLQELCHTANERFYKLTGQKLSLEMTEDNNFQVRDFMNGGKVRNVKTLSGGQTFQAALSLALALADNIQKITESDQNFFFLDEGFGSLDKDALDIVFDTLKSLRKENRIVGVISHVEEMQQEIDTHLKITNDEEKGSIIKNSWN